MAYFNMKWGVSGSLKRFMLIPIIDIMLNYVNIKRENSPPLIALFAKNGRDGGDFVVLLPQ